MKKHKRKVVLPQHYSSINTLPIIKWEAINKGDLSQLLIKPRKLKLAEKAELLNVWKAIYDEYISVFGVGDNFKSMLSKSIEISMLQQRLIISKDISVINFIKRKEKELETLKKVNTGGKGDIYSLKMAIESNMKIYLPINTITVREFYAYAEQLKKSV